MVFLELWLLQNTNKQPRARRRTHLCSVWPYGHQRQKLTSSLVSKNRNGHQRETYIVSLSSGQYRSLQTDYWTVGVHKDCSNQYTWRAMLLYPTNSIALYRSEKHAAFPLRPSTPSTANVGLWILMNMNVNETHITHNAMFTTMQWLNTHQTVNSYTVEFK